MAKARTLVVDHRRERNRWRAPADTRRTRARTGGRPGASLLKPVESFGANPGALGMLAYAPRDLASGSPLVVVLHGCSQDALGYDASSGWSRLADECGFAVVFPEQRRANNPGGCFNWFLPAHSARGLGETRSIREMVEHMATTHAIDRARVFVTGLSAGGAMASALLADYPEVFSAGAVIAGLPCGAASSMQEAFRAMSDPRPRSAEELGDMVRAASPHAGPWPRMLVLHGTADETVAPGNADAIVSQWLDVHGLSPDEARDDAVDGHFRMSWTQDGRTVVQQIMVAEMGHGAPLDVGSGERKAPFMLDVGLSSTRRIADFFGISGALPQGAGSKKAAALAASPATEPEPALQRRTEEPEAPLGWPFVARCGSALGRLLRGSGLR